jgi:hypothetical protein
MSGVESGVPRRYKNPCERFDECDQSGGGCGECSAINYGIEQGRKAIKAAEEDRPN